MKILFSIVPVAAVLFLFSSCKINKPVKNDEGLHHKVAISKNDMQLIFAYMLNGKFSLYELDIASGEISLFQEVNGSCLNPSFSTDGKRILYISYEKEGNGTKNCLILINRDGSEMKKVLEANAFILEAVFLPDSERIYFATAASFGNSSPLVQPSFRGMSVFSIDTTGNDLRRELNAYQIQHLSFTTDSRYLFFELHQMQQDSLHGPYMFNLINRSLEPLIPANSNSLQASSISSFWHPVASHSSDSVFLISAFKLFKMPVSTKIARTIYSSPGNEIDTRFRILDINLFSTSDKILMIKQKSKKEAGLFILDAKGEVEKELTLDMAKFRHLQ